MILIIISKIKKKTGKIKIKNSNNEIINIFATSILSDMDNNNENKKLNTLTSNYEKNIKLYKEETKYILFNELKNKNIHIKCNFNDLKKHLANLIKYFGKNF